MGGGIIAHRRPAVEAGPDHQAGMDTEDPRLAVTLAISRGNTHGQARTSRRSWVTIIIQAT